VPGRTIDTESTIPALELWKGLKSCGGVRVKSGAMFASTKVVPVHEPTKPKSCPGAGEPASTSACRYTL
jgi:hypothetical protein